jgi:hypothetical protein
MAVSLVIVFAGHLRQAQSALSLQAELGAMPVIASQLRYISRGHIAGQLPSLGIVSKVTQIQFTHRKFQRRKALIQARVYAMRLP